MGTTTKVSRIEKKQQDSLLREEEKEWRQGVREGMGKGGRKEGKNTATLLNLGR